jgi:competence protein ComEC
VPHSSSKPPAAADATLRIGELALAVLSGAVLALLIEAAGALDGITVPGIAVSSQWPVAILLVGVAAHRHLRPCWRPLPGLLAGLWLALAQLVDYHCHLLPESASGRQLVIARVLSIPERHGDELRFVAELAAARPDEVGASDISAPVWPLRVRLLWRRAPPVAVGERWQLPVALTELIRVRNPGQGWFDRQSLRAGLHAGGVVLESRLIQRLQSAPLSIDGLRAWLSAAIHAQIAERDSAALLVALAVGDTQYVSREQWRVFNAVGITHLIAISGLHVTLFSLLTAAAARHIWALLPWLCRHVRREHCAALIGVSAACIYALLSGFSVPAQRTLVMLATWHGLRCLARPAAVAPALAVALLWVLCLDPLAPLGAGFWLSFAAVAVLMHALPAGPAPAGNAAGLMRRGAHAALELWRTQWRVAVGLLPVTLAVFGSASIAGLYVNLFAIPLFSFALVPLILLSLPLLPTWPVGAHVLLQIAAWIAAATMPWLTRAADWEFALWRIQAPVWAVLLAVPAVWLLLLPGRWFLRGTAYCALLPLLWPRESALASGEFTATMLDTGRGQAVVLRTAHHALLYDNGEHWGSDGAITREVLLPALRAARLRNVDRVLMPRLDNDRGVGLAALAVEVSVGRWQTGGATAELPPEFAPCARGERWQWDGVQFENLLEGECAVRVSVSAAAGGSGARLLLAAEIDRDAQRRLIDAGAARSDALIVPRHAASTAYLSAFRDASAARWALVAQSRRAAASASVQRTLQAWRDGGARLWVTGVDGAVTLRGSIRGIDAQPAGD